MLLLKSITQLYARPGPFLDGADGYIILRRLCECVPLQKYSCLTIVHKGTIIDCFLPTVKQTDDPKKGQILNIKLVQVYPKNTLCFKNWSMANQFSIVWKKKQHDLLRLSSIFTSSKNYEIVIFKNAIQTGLP